LVLVEIMGGASRRPQALLVEIAHISLSTTRRRDCSSMASAPCSASYSSGRLLAGAGTPPPLSEASSKDYEFNSKTSTSEANMSTEPDDIRIIRLHKKWADGYTLLSQLLILLLFTGVFLLSEQLGLGPAERAGAFILLAAMVLAAAIWQAVGLGIARVHMLLDGIDLEKRSKHGAGPRTRRP
jgi:hypothetical protein